MISSGVIRLYEYKYSMNIIKKLKYDDDLIQWLVVISIAYYRVESLMMVLILLLTRWRGVTTYCRVATILLLHVSVMCLILDYSIWFPLKELVLLGLHGIGYFTFFKARVGTIQGVWDKYLTFSFWVALAGIFELVCLFTIHKDPFSFIGHGVLAEGDSGMIMRLHSFFGEPGYLAVFLVPSVIYSLLNISSVTKKRFGAIMFVFILTFAAAAYVSLLLFFIYWLLSSKYKKFVYLLVPFCLVGILFLQPGPANTEDLKNNNTGEIYNRIDESVSAFTSMDPYEFELLNASTYALMTNFWVACNAPSRLLGTGVGTNQQSYERLYKSDFGLYGLCKEDGYSLANRLLSENGILGLLIAIVLIVKGYNKNNAINISTLFYIFAIMVRGGHYTANGVFFFLMIYYFTSKVYLKKQRKYVAC